MIRTSFLWIALLFLGCQPDVEPQDFTAKYVGVYEYSRLFSYEVDPSTGLPFFEDYQTVVLTKASPNRVDLEIIHTNDPQKNIRVGDVPVNESSTFGGDFSDFSVEGQIEPRGLLIRFFDEAGEIRRVLATP